MVINRAATRPTAVHARCEYNQSAQPLLRAHKGSKDGIEAAAHVHTQLPSALHRPCCPREGILPHLAHHLKTHDARFSIAVAHPWPFLRPEVTLYIWEGVSIVEVQTARSTVTDSQTRD